MGRFMALKEQYAKDRDAFKWARSTVALPEVRAAVWKFAQKPEVWTVSFQMMTEALKEHRPPKPIYDETMRFITTDTGVSNYISQFASDVMPSLGKMTSGAVAMGLDLGPLMNLATQAVPGGGAAAGKAPAAATLGQKR